MRMIHHRGLFLVQILVLVALSMVHFSALAYSLYFYLPWFDILAHFLGGLWVALMGAWLWLRFGAQPTWWRLLLVTLAVGIAWEIFELVAGIPREANYMLDTFIDLIMDFMGAAVAIMVVPTIRRYA